jgi:hypothetical protein
VVTPHGRFEKGDPQMIFRGKALLRKRKTFIASCALALLAVGATAAFAGNWYVNGVPLAPVGVEGTVENFFIHDESLKFTVLCSGVDSQAAIGPTWHSHLEIKFTSCSVSEHEAECAVSEPIVVNLQDQVVNTGPKEEGAGAVDILYPEGQTKYGGGTWATVTITKGTGACSFAAKYSITGSQVAKLRVTNKTGEELGAKEVEKVDISANEANGKTEAEGLEGEYFNNATGKAEKAGELTIGSKAWLEGGAVVEMEGHEHIGAH